MAFTVRVDRESCIGIGACEAAVPALFALHDDGYAEVVDGAPADALRAAAEGAAAGCPMAAIHVHDS